MNDARELNLKNIRSLQAVDGRSSRLLDNIIMENRKKIANVRFRR